MRPVVEAAIARAGDNEQQQAKLLTTLGDITAYQGDFEASRQHYERSIEIWQRVVDSHHPQLAITLNNLGLTLSDQGKTEEAQLRYEHSLAIWEKAVGPDHPETATLHLNLWGQLRQSKKIGGGSLPPRARPQHLGESARS